MKRHNNNLILYLARLLLILMVIAAWEITGRRDQFVNFILGTPSAIFYEFLQMVLKEQFAYHFVITGGEAIAGFILGTALGTILGLSTWMSARITNIMRPIIITAASFPILSIAPLLIVWFGVGYGMKIALAGLSTVFVAFNQANRGATLVSAELIDSLKGMNASNFAIFKLIVIPGSFDWVLNSIRLNIGFALMGAFIGEFIASSAGLGHLILKSSSLYNVPKAFASTLGITILALVLDRLAISIENNRYKIIQYFSVSQTLQG